MPIYLSITISVELSLLIVHGVIFTWYTACSNDELCKSIEKILDILACTMLTGMTIIIMECFISYILLR